MPSSLHVKEPSSIPSIPKSQPTDGITGGLASAEASLFAVQRSNAEIDVQRSVIQFRVDYLAQLNTQTTLLAGAAIAMFSSLELEAITTQEELSEEDLTSWSSHTFICFIFITCSSISLGSSLWVLYTSNNLINLATSASLYARHLKDLQDADAVIGLRMTEVRQRYFHALLALIPSVLSMTMRILPWYGWISASLIIARYLVHGIHEDYISEHHLMETAFAHLPIHTLRPEWALERFAQSISRFMNRLAPWMDSYPFLASIFSATLGEGSLPKAQRRMSRDEPDPAPNTLIGKRPAGWMFKTASNKGPSALVGGLKLANADGQPDTGAILKAILAAPATTPTYLRWWTLEGKVLTCFVSPEEASEKSNVNERLVIDLSHYVVGRTVDAAGYFAIALIPYSLIGIDSIGRIKSSPWILRRNSSKKNLADMESSDGADDNESTRYRKESKRYEGDSSHAGSSCDSLVDKSDQDRSWYLLLLPASPCLPPVPHPNVFPPAPHRHPLLTPPLLRLRCRYFSGDPPTSPGERPSATEEWYQLLTRVCMEVSEDGELHKPRHPHLGPAGALKSLFKGVSTALHGTATVSTSVAATITPSQTAATISAATISAATVTPSQAAATIMPSHARGPSVPAESELPDDEVAATVHRSRGASFDRDQILSQASQPSQPLRNQPDPAQTLADLAHELGVLSRHLSPRAPATIADTTITIPSLATATLAPSAATITPSTVPASSWRSRLAGAFLSRFRQTTTPLV